MFGNDIEASKRGIKTFILKGLINGVKRICHFFRHIKIFSMKRKYKSPYFSDEELNILIKLHKVSNRTPTTLIIENIHLANINDLTFFRQLIASNFLYNHKNLKLVLVSESSTVNGVSLADYRLNCVYNVELTEEEMVEIIQNSNPHLHISTERLKRYIRICKDNMNLLQLIVRTNIDDAIASDNVLNALQNKIHDILHNLGAVNALEFAAVVGLTFDLTFLHSVSEIELDEIRRQAEAAYEQGIFFKSEEANYTFIDDIIKEIVYRHGTEQVSAHNKCAKYFNEADPFEHLVISRHSYMGGNCEHAVIHYLAYLLDCHLNNKQIDNSIPYLTQINNVITNNIFYNAASITVNELLSKFTNNNLSLNDLTLRSLAKQDNSALDYFVEYVKKVLLYKSKLCASQHDFLDLGYALEESYKFFVNEQILGLQIQCAFILLDVYSYRLDNIEKISGITSMLRSLNLALQTKNHADYSLLLKLSRKIASVEQAEAAYERTRQIYMSCRSVKYKIDEVELYRFLSDHIGYALYSGRYASIADETVKDMQKYLNVTDNLCYPKSYKLFMNNLLYRLYTNKISVKEIKKFVKNEFKKRTSFSTMYNYDVAALALYCNELNIAEKMLLELQKTIQNDLTCFYDYCVTANLVSLCVLKGDYANAQAYNAHILQTDYDWYEDFVEIMKYRAQLFVDIIQNKQLYNQLLIFM